VHKGQVIHYGPANTDNTNYTTSTNSVRRGAHTALDTSTLKNSWRSLILVILRTKQLPYFLGVALSVYLCVHLICNGARDKIFRESEPFRLNVSYNDRVGP